MPALKAGRGKKGAFLICLEKYNRKRIYEIDLRLSKTIFIEVRLSSIMVY
jgi:hypothetical protein